jgi:hypothetical protein
VEGDGGLQGLLQLRHHRHQRPDQQLSSPHGPQHSPYSQNFFKAYQSAAFYALCFSGSKLIQGILALFTLEFDFLNVNFNYIPTMI